MKKIILSILISVLLAPPAKVATADIFGGDVAVLMQILTTSLKQLSELRQMLATGEDTLDLLRDVNRGLKDGLSVIQIIAPKLDPGVLGIDDPQRLSQDLTQIYGEVPKTGDERLQTTHDQSVTESLTMNTKLYKYADQVDLERDKILEHSKEVNPQGAAKLQNQSLAVLIGVSTQLLRTNSAMLKLMAENLALQNRKEKVSSSQFKTQYEGLSKAISDLPADTKLPATNGGN
jgi:hypothetical protein